MPQLVVLSYNEITRDTKIESVAMVSDAVAVGSGQSAVGSGSRQSAVKCPPHIFTAWTRRLTPISNP